MRFIFILIPLFFAVKASEKPYRGFRVVNVEGCEKPVTKEIIDSFSPDNGNVDYWIIDLKARRLVALIDLEAADDFIHYWTDFGCSCETLTEDVQIDLDVAEAKKMSSRSFDTESQSFEFDHFWRYSEVMDYIDFLAKSFPMQVEVTIAGHSYENRPIKALKITSPERSKVRKPVIFVNSLIHAREWVALMSGLYLMYELVENADRNIGILQHVDWVIIPLSNPDGYIFTEQQRFYRGNRNPSYNKRCPGVDLNRNFPFKWVHTVDANCASMSTYQGPKPASEPETRAIMTMMRKYQGDISLFLDLHCSGPYILYPFNNGFHPELVAQNYKLAAKARNAAQKYMEPIPEGSLEIGNAEEVLYPTRGTSDDYAAGEMNIPYVYTIELYGEGQGIQRFTLPPEKLPNATKAAFAMMETMALHVINNPPIQSRMMTDSGTMNQSFGIFLLFLISYCLVKF